MKRLAALAVIGVLGCSAVESPSAEDRVAIYESLRQEHFGIDTAIVQEVTDSVNLHWFDLGSRNGPPDLDTIFRPEVAEALADLAGLTSGELLPNSVRASLNDRRITRDSMQSIFRAIQARRLDRLPRRVSAVQLSGVGFSKDRTVAVVARNDVCGIDCGGYKVQVVRRHPAGWRAAEVLMEAVY